MDAKTLIACLEVLPATQAVLIRGDHGIGKSQIVSQLNEKKGRVLIDVRASTMQEGDVVGYPDLEKIKTHGVASFALPSWFVRACMEPCTLFLDELNRGLVGVLNGMFQIVLDRELGSGLDGKPLKLHPGTQVVAAVNWGGSYTVNEMDDALLSRFWMQDFKPTVHDWIVWASASGVNTLLIDFIRTNPTHLRPTKTVEPGKKTPDQRAWVKLDETLKHAGIDLEESGGNPPDLLYPIAMGFVGVEAAAALVDYVKNYDALITAEDVLDRWSKFSKRVEELTMEKRLGLIEKIKVHCATNDWSSNQMLNLKKFFDVLSGEAKMNLFTSMMSTNKSENLVRFNTLVNSEIMRIIQQANALDTKK